MEFNNCFKSMVREDNALFYIMQMMSGSPNKTTCFAAEQFHKINQIYHNLILLKKLNTIGLKKTINRIENIIFI